MRLLHLKLLISRAYFYCREFLVGVCIENGFEVDWLGEHIREGANVLTVSFLVHRHPSLAIKGC